MKPDFASELLRIQARVLETIASGRDLQVCLDELCGLTSAVVPGSISSIMLLDDARAALNVAAAPGVPTELIDVLDGLVPCEAAGSCGTAVYLDEPVFVVDTATDARWVPLRPIAEQFGIRSCWSIPIHVSDQVAGSFALSHLENRAPSEQDRKLLQTASHLAGLALERERRIADLERARLRAEYANQAKSRFLANMSHEIRTPLTSIVGYADILNDETMSDQSRAYVTTLRDQGEHLLGLIDDLLDLSRIESDTLAVVFEECSLRHEIGCCVEAVRSKAVARGLDLQWNVDPECADRFVTDPLRFRQVIVNVLENGIKFSDSGAVRVRATSTDDGNLAIDISDSGIGIESDATESIFETFFRAEQKREQPSPGAGLGLPLSRRVMTILGGSIRLLESKPGAGSTFRIEHPLGLAPTPRPAESSPSEWPTSVSTDEASIRILVAEDVPEIQRLIRAILEGSGMQVTTVENGEDAIEAALAAESAGCPFDVIVMDIRMPKLDGYEATKRLRALGYERPILSVTAYAMSGDRERCLEAGCDEYLSKPIRRKEIVEAIQNLIQVT